MGESADLNSAQQEAEAHLSQSKETIQELQSALKAAQVMPHVCPRRPSQYMSLTPIVPPPYPLPSPNFALYLPVSACGTLAG